MNCIGPETLCYIFWTEYGNNVESRYLLLHLLGHKIFTQLGIYCPIDYCPNNMVRLSLHKKDP